MYSSIIKKIILSLQSQISNEDGKMLRRSITLKADVAKLVDALDLGSSAARHGGSSPSIRTQTPTCFETLACYKRGFCIYL